VTLFGLFLTPVFYVVIRAKLARRRERAIVPLLADEPVQVSNDPGKGR
jgi:hypothetical protein